MTNVQLTLTKYTFWCTLGISGVMITKMKADSLSFSKVWHDTLAFLVVFSLSSRLEKISGQVLQDVRDII